MKNPDSLNYYKICYKSPVNGKRIFLLNFNQMELNDLQTEQQGDTRYFCSVVVNTKGKGLPGYLKDFINEQARDTAGMFELRVVFNQTGNIAFWRENYPAIKDTDTLFQFVFAFNEELDDADFQQYMHGIIVENIMPYCIGCGFDFFGMYYIYKLPPQYIGLAKEGELSVKIHAKRVSPVLSAILTDVFCLTRDEADSMEETITIIGEVVIENCLTADKIAEFKELMSLENIKFEIQ